MEEPANGSVRLRTVDLDHLDACDGRARMGR